MFDVTASQHSGSAGLCVMLSPDDDDNGDDERKRKCEHEQSEHDGSVCARQAWGWRQQ